MDSTHYSKDVDLKNDQSKLVPAISNDRNGSEIGMNSETPSSDISLSNFMSSSFEIL